MRTNSKNARPKPTTQTSKPASKTLSQVPNKKVEEKKVIIKSDGKELKDAFELFYGNNGRINDREIRQAIQNIYFDEKNP